MARFEVKVFLNTLTYVVEAEDRDQACESAYEYAERYGIHDILKRADYEVELIDG